MEWKGAGGKNDRQEQGNAFMRASKLYELPKSTLKYTVNNKEQNTEKLVIIRSYSKPVFSEPEFRPFSEKRLCGRNWEHSIPNFANIAFSLFLK